MARYRRRFDGAIMDELTLRSEAESLLPGTLTMEALDSMGFDPILETTKPVGSLSQYPVELPPVLKELPGIGERYVINWELVNYTDEQMVYRRAGAIASMQRLIRGERDARYLAGVSIDVSGKTYWFETTTETQLQLWRLNFVAEVMSVMGGASVDTWKTMSGEKLSLTPEILKELIIAEADRTRIIFNNSEKHLAALQVAEDPTTYDYRTGWPQSYLEWEAAQSI